MPMSPHNTIMHVVMETLNVSDKMYAVDCKCRDVTARCFKLCMLSVCDACCDILRGMCVIASSRDYPHFFEKLYALLQPSVFYVKYMQRFFALLDTFLRST